MGCFLLRLFTLYHRFQTPLVVPYTVVEASLSEGFSQFLFSVLGLIFAVAMLLQLSQQHFIVPCYSFFISLVVGLGQFSVLI